MKPFLRAGLLLLALAGVVLAIWPMGQSAYAMWSQRQLRAAWHDHAKPHDAKLHGGVTPAQRAGKTSVAAASSTLAEPVALRSRQPWPSTRLTIPSIDLDVMVVQGTNDDALRNGPGHWRSSALPGQPGNCVIAGHRNIYGSYFYRLDELWPDSLIQLSTSEHTYTYKVLVTRIVSEVDTTPLESSPAPDAVPLLTLLTCTLPKSANRIIVQAELVSIDGS